HRLHQSNQKPPGLLLRPVPVAGPSGFPCTTGRLGGPSRSSAPIKTGEASAAADATRDAMKSAVIYAGAAIAEIGGCFAFWAWLRLGQSALWLAPGLLLLVLFACLLTLVDAGAAGRAYAAYGGIYIVASLLWLWAVEGLRPDRWDVIGGCVAL